MTHHMIHLTQREARLVVLAQQAVQAMNDLIVYVESTGNTDLLPFEVRSRLIEADYLLNSSVDSFVHEDDQIHEHRKEPIA